MTRTQLWVRFFAAMFHLVVTILVGYAGWKVTNSPWMTLIIYYTFSRLDGIYWEVKHGDKK